MDIGKLQTAFNECLIGHLDVEERISCWNYFVELAQRAGSGEAIYQHKSKTDSIGLTHWVDCTREIYDSCPEAQRRALYTAPPPQPDSDARIRGLEIALAQALEIPKPDSGRDAALQYLIECLRDENEGKHSCSKLVRYAFESYEKAMAAQQGEKGGVK